MGKRKSSRRENDRRGPASIAMDEDGESSNEVDKLIYLHMRELKAYLLGFDIS